MVVCLLVYFTFYVTMVTSSRCVITTCQTNTKQQPLLITKVYSLWSTGVSRDVEFQNSRNYGNYIISMEDTGAIARYTHYGVHVIFQRSLTNKL